MDKLFVVALSNWIVIAIFVIQLIGFGSGNGDNYDYGAPLPIGYGAKYDRAPQYYEQNQDSYSNPKLLEYGSRQSQSYPAQSSEAGNYEIPEEYRIEYPSEKIGESRKSESKAGGGKQGDSAKLAYKELYETNGRLGRDEVVQKLNRIRSSDYAQKASIGKYSIEDLIEYNVIRDEKCKVKFMEKFNKLYKTVASSKKIVKRYVVETYNAQMDACKEAIRKEVSQFQRDEHWGNFMSVYTRMQGSLESEYAAKESMEDYMDTTPTANYYTLVGIKRVCGGVVEGLDELLKIQQQFNRQALNDREFAEYYKYFKASRTVVGVHDWGPAIDRKLHDSVGLGGLMDFSESLSAWSAGIPVSHDYQGYHQDHYQPYQSGGTYGQHGQNSHYEPYGQDWHNGGY